MSLFSSLSQVLAPYAAKLNGLLTGWDGTQYSSPGEAVRQQISDLHVLIGDEPGTAIDASAIGYGEDSNVEDALDGLNGRLGDLEDNAYIRGDAVEVTGWKNGYIRAADGTIGASTTTCVAGWITFENGPVYVTVAEGYKISVSQYLNTVGTHGTFDRHIIRPSEGGSLQFTADSTKFYKIQISKTVEEEFLPSDLPESAVTYQQDSFTDKTLTLPGKIADAKVVGDEIRKEYIGENALNPTTLTLDAFINSTSGTQGSSTAYAVTDFIPVAEGDVVRATYGEDVTSISMRYCAAYNDKKTLIPSSGAENVFSYTVPEGVAYVRISGNKIRMTSKYARITRNYVSGQKIYYQPYFDGRPVDFGISNRTEIFKILGYPLSTFPVYVLNALAYRPLGVLSKGYICLVSDDGDAELATYTIPMLQSKGDVPCTFAVMRVSTVFGSQSGIDAVVDAVQNHGCEIAQHGITTFDQYDELTLNGFFDDEKAYWDSLGLTAYGAVCPAHNINNLIRVVCGGRFGCLRTGYDDGKPCYQNYTNGPKSNIFGLTSQSSVDGTLDTQKATLDLVAQNHWLRMLHWHENELTAEKKTQLEGIIDYAQSIGLTFITMKDIPNII